MADAAAREEALQNSHLLQLEEQRSRSIINRWRLDAESCVEAPWWELMTTQVSEQALWRTNPRHVMSVRRAWRSWRCVFTMASMRMPAMRNSVTSLVQGTCDAAIQANAALARQSSAMIRMREAFNQQTTADKNEMAQMRRQIADLKDWQRSGTSQNSAVGSAMSSSVGMSRTAPALAAPISSVTRGPTQHAARNSAGLADTVTRLRGGPPDLPGGDEGTEPESPHRGGGRDKKESRRRRSPLDDPPSGGVDDEPDARGGDADIVRRGAPRRSSRRGD